MVDIEKHGSPEPAGAGGAGAGAAAAGGGAGASGAAGAAAASAGAEHPAAGAGEAAHDEHKEPPYFVIWFVLLVLTLAEVGYAFLSLPKFWLALGLIVMAFWKATLVALYYMHLRFEPRRLWVLAASPLPLVAILILAVLTEY